MFKYFRVWALDFREKYSSILYADNEETNRKAKVKRVEFICHEGEKGKSYDDI